MEIKATSGKQAILSAELINLPPSTQQAAPVLQLSEAGWKLGETIWGCCWKIVCEGGFKRTKVCVLHKFNYWNILYTEYKTVYLENTALFFHWGQQEL